MQTSKQNAAAILYAVFGLCLALPPAQAADQTLQEASVNFVRTYFQEWSSTNAVALAFMDQVFPDQVSYFNKQLSHAALMAAKRHFAERWPERSFAARAGNISVTCDDQHFCTVWGLVDWNCRSQSRHSEASGTSVFSFQLQDGQTMTAEDGFVLTRGQEMAQQPPEDRTVSDNGTLADTPAPQTSSGQTTSASSANRQPQYTDNDIPALRNDYYAHASERNWVTNWLMAQRQFIGTLRSLGPEGAHTVSGSNGGALNFTMFEAAQGPVACMTSSGLSTPAPGESVRIKGIVSIFIDQTMYLTQCSLA